MNSDSESLDFESADEESQDVDVDDLIDIENDKDFDFLKKNTDDQSGVLTDQIKDNTLLNKDESNKTSDRTGEKTENEDKKDEITSEIPELTNLKLANISGQHESSEKKTPHTVNKPEVAMKIPEPIDNKQPETSSSEPLHEKEKNKSSNILYPKVQDVVNADSNTESFVQKNIVKRDTDESATNRPVEKVNAVVANAVQRVDSAKYSALASNEKNSTQSSENNSQSENKPILSTNPKLERNDAAVSSSSWSWSKFGSNIISSATTLTSQLVESVEAAIGAPDPIELAMKLNQEQQQYSTAPEKTELDREPETEVTPNESKSVSEDAKENENDWFSFQKFNSFASTGTHLVTGGLNVLESVGKKTFKAINDKDPNLMQTRSFLKNVPDTILPNNKKENLSQLLREAKLSCKNDKPNTAVSESEKQKLNKFSSLFEEYKGTVHLEALEMISQQMTAKNHINSSDSSLQADDVQTQLELLDDIFDENYDHETQIENDQKHFKSLLLNANKERLLDAQQLEDLMRQFAQRSEINVKVINDAIINSFAMSSTLNKKQSSTHELYNEYIKSFCLITSSAIQLYHKSAESLLINQQSKSNGTSNANSSCQTAQVLFEITRLSMWSVATLGDDCSKKIKEIEKDSFFSVLDDPSPNQLIADIYFEASNSNTYMYNSFLLLLPIFRSLLRKVNKL